MQQIGILGGTFNPPHLGHVHAAVCAADELGLDRVLMLPGYQPPHKETADRSPSAEQRLEMVRLAALADPRLTADDCEIRRGGKSYTVFTLQELRIRFPQAKLTFLCGTDMFLTLDRWFRAEELLKLARFAVAPRTEGKDEALQQKAEELRQTFGADVCILRNPVLELSSSEIRERLQNGDFQGLSAEVAAYIRENRLYDVGMR